MPSLRDPKWNPYLAGVAAGVLLVLSVLVAGKYFGASTSFVRSAGLIEQAADPDRVARMPYFMKYLGKTPGIDWQWMFVVGIFAGALVSSKLGGTFRAQAVPDSWRERFGVSVPRRAAAAFCGGVVALFGARLAGGCPSGHGLSGVSQLAVSGLIALVMFFVGGLITARILYRGK